MRNLFILTALVSTSAMANQKCIDDFILAAPNNTYAKAVLHCDPVAKARHDAVKAQAAKPGARIGMTKHEVLNKTSWGKPDDINSTTTVKGTLEQWVYSGGYLYFTNGRLIAIQN